MEIISAEFLHFGGCPGKGKPGKPEKKTGKKRWKGPEKEKGEKGKKKGERRETPENPVVALTGIAAAPKYALALSTDLAPHNSDFPPRCIARQ